MPKLKGLWAHTHTHTHTEPKLKSFIITRAHAHII